MHQNPSLGLLFVDQAIVNIMWTFCKNLSPGAVWTFCKRLLLVVSTLLVFWWGLEVFRFCSVEPPVNLREASVKFADKIDATLHMKSVSVLEVLCEPLGIETVFKYDTDFKDAKTMLKWCANKCPMHIPPEIGHAFVMCSDSVNRESSELAEASNGKAFSQNSATFEKVKQEWDKNKFATEKCDATTLSWVADLNKVTDRMIRDGIVDHFDTALSQNNWIESSNLEDRYYQSIKSFASSQSEAHRLARHLKICAYSYKTNAQTLEFRAPERVYYWVTQCFIGFLLYQFPSSALMRAIGLVAIFYMCVTSYSFAEFIFRYKALIAILSVVPPLYRLFPLVYEEH